MKEAENQRDSSSAHVRNTDIDIVKGMLVLVMIVWHGTFVLMTQKWTRTGWVVQDRVEFIHYAFIAISGFLCGWHYGPGIGEEGASVRKRLAIRGLKLVLFVVGATSVLYMGGLTCRFEELAGAAGTFEGFMDNLILNVNGNLVAFELVLYIAALLFWASCALGRSFAFAASSAALAVLLVFSPCLLVFYMCFGVTGVLIGLGAGKGLFDGVWRFLERTRGIPAMASLIFYQAGLPQIRQAMKAIPVASFLLYCLETLLWFLTFVFLYRSVSATWWQGPVIRLGQYTLVGYIGQVAIIRFLYHAISGGEAKNLEIGGYLATVSITVVSVYLLIVAIDFLRVRSGAIDRAYRVVFG